MYNSSKPGTTLGALIKNKKKFSGAPFMAQWLANPTRIYEDVGSISGLDQWVKDQALL